MTATNILFFNTATYQFIIHYLMQRLLETLAQQYAAEEIGPLYLNIDSRMTPVRSPEEISTALVDVLTTEKFQNIKKYIGFDRFKELLSSLDIKVAVKGSSSLPFFDSELQLELAKKLQKDEGNLTLTIKKYKKLLTALGPLPTKPVIVIGTVQTYSENKQPLVFFPPLLMIFPCCSPLQITLSNMFHYLQMKQTNS